LYFFFHLIPLRGKITDFGLILFAKINFVLQIKAKKKVADDSTTFLCEISKD